MKQHIDGLLQKKMDRLSFLKHVGVGFVAVTGVSGVVKSMSSFGGSDTIGSANQADGYGASVYGGKSLQGAQTPRI